MKKLIAIIGIDSFLKKNYNQIKCLNHNGVSVEVLTNNTMNTSVENMNIINNQTKNKNSIILLEPKFLSRVKQIYDYLKKNKSVLNHIEVYPAGRFTFIYVLLARLIGVKIVCIERGDIGKFDRHTFLTSISMKLTYRFSTLVIYKELYMKSLLLSLHAKNISLLYNCIDNFVEFENLAHRSYSFLWVNRLVKERKIEWVVDLVKEGELNSTINILGILENRDTYIQTNINLVNSLKNYGNVEIYGYINPENFYKETKFFLLPSDIVFVNNALLEAMSYGVVPLISNVSGADKIIEDGIDGFIFEHTKEGFKKAIERALSLSEEEVQRMSLAAREKVKNKFSCNEWCKRYISIINGKI